MGNRRALIIGINEYEFDPLAFAVNDADELSTILSMPEYGFDVRILRDKQATRADILTELQEAIAAKPEVFVFYFSGHAFQGFGERTFIATIDAQRPDEGLDMSYLTDILDGFDNDCPTFAMLDCCHSGVIATWVGRPPASRDQLSRLLTYSPSRAVYAACRPDEAAYSAVSSDHGAFTHYLLDALCGAASDPRGEVTVDGLYSYVARHLDHAGQTTTLRCDAVGQTVLGRGFTPSGQEPLTREEVLEVATQASQLMSEYASRLGPLLDDWSAGYEEACRSLRSTKEWFSRMLSKHPEAKNNPEFAGQFKAMQARLAFLQALEPGLVLERYKVVEFLGSGGFGSVWRMRPTGGGPDLAFKAFSPHDVYDQNKHRMFVRGYNAMQKLHHEHVVSVHKKSEVPEGFYMDFVEGRNLEQVGPLGDDPPKALRFMILVAETVKHAHDRGVVHRDIKPPNILISYTEDGDPIPYLVDFDLAWYSTATMVTEDALATLAYGAPEFMQAPRSGAARRPAVDTFGFAQVCFFVLIGENPVPFNVSLNCETLRRRLGEWQSLGLATEFVSWYARNSDVNPGLRQDDFGDVIEELTEMELKAISASRSMNQLGNDQFLSEVYYSIAGLVASSHPRNPSSFRSLSGRSMVSLKIDSERRDASVTHYDMTAEVELGELALKGVNHGKAREILNGRVDRALRSHPGATKSFGNHGAYSVFVHVPGCSGNAAGVRKARTVLSDVLLAVETA